MLLSTWIGSNSYEKVKTFKYLDSLVTNKNFVQEELKCRLKTGNSCYYSVQILLSSRLRISISLLGLWSEVMLKKKKWKQAALESGFDFSVWQLGWWTEAAKFKKWLEQKQHMETRRWWGQVTIMVWSCYYLGKWTVSIIVCFYSYNCKKLRKQLVVVIAALPTSKTWFPWGKFIFYQGKCTRTHTKNLMILNIHLN